MRRLEKVLARLEGMQKVIESNSDVGLIKVIRG
jgi:hypothetical protein